MRHLHDRVVQINNIEELLFLEAIQMHTPLSTAFSFTSEKWTAHYIWIGGPVPHKFLRFQIVYNKSLVQDLDCQYRWCKSQRQSQSGLTAQNTSHQHYREVQNPSNAMILLREKVLLCYENFWCLTIEMVQLYT